MSIIERIKEIQQVQAGQAARAKAASEVAAEKERLEKLENEKRSKEAFEKMMQSRQQKTDEVLKESGVLEGFRQIKNNFLDGKFKNCEIVYSYGYDYPSHINEPEPTVRIVWGHSDVEIDKRDSTDTLVRGDHFSISASVNLYTEDITITAKTKTKLNKSEWSNKETIEKILADAFINPRWYQTPWDYHTPYDGGNC